MTILILVTLPAQFLSLHHHTFEIATTVQAYITICSWTLSNKKSNNKDHSIISLPAKYICTKFIHNPGTSTHTLFAHKNRKVNSFPYNHYYCSSYGILLSLSIASTLSKFPNNVYQPEFQPGKVCISITLQGYLHFRRTLAFPCTLIPADWLDREKEREIHVKGKQSWLYVHNNNMLAISSLFFILSSAYLPILENSCFRGKSSRAGATK